MGFHRKDVSVLGKPVGKGQYPLQAARLPLGLSPGTRASPGHRAPCAWRHRASRCGPLRCGWHMSQPLHVISSHPAEGSQK